MTRFITHLLVLGFCFVALVIARTPSKISYEGDEGGEGDLSADDEESQPATTEKPVEDLPDGESRGVLGGEPVQ